MIIHAKIYKVQLFMFFSFKKEEMNECKYFIEKDLIAISRAVS